MRRIVLAVASDLHCGNKFGLYNPATVLQQETEDGGIMNYSPVPTACQEYLWRQWIDGLQFVQATAGNDEVVMLVLGDVCQGNKRPVELITSRVADQFVIARYALHPWMQLPNLRVMRLAKGTAAHAFDEGSAELLVAEMLQLQYPEKSAQAVYHGLLEVNGVSVDMAHHGPHPGTRDWLRGNVARFYLRDLMYQEIIAAKAPPMLVLRGHYHSPVREILESNGYMSVLHVLAPMCMMGDYAHQATRSKHQVQTGMLVLELVDGRVVNEWRRYEKLDIRTVEVL